MNTQRTAPRYYLNQSRRSKGRYIHLYNRGLFDRDQFV